MSHTIETLAAWLSTSSPSQQAKFSEALTLMLKEGLLWRDDGADLDMYAFLVRHLGFAQEYFALSGLKLIHHERLHILQLMSDHPGLRRTFSKETTLWALLCRLIYAEVKESATLSLSRYPTVMSGDLFIRYSELFPARNLRKKTAFGEALSELTSAKLIRAAAAASNGMSDPEVTIELLPTLEVLIPATRLKDISDRITEFGAC